VEVIGRRDVPINRPDVSNAAKTASEKLRCRRSRPVATSAWSRSAPRAPHWVVSSTAVRTARWRGLRLRAPCQPNRARRELGRADHCAGRPPWRRSPRAWTSPMPAPRRSRRSRRLTRLALARARPCSSWAPPGEWAAFFVQVAAAAGANVIAPALPDDHDYLQRLGVSDLIDRNKNIDATVREAHPDGVDAILDAVSFTPDTSTGLSRRDWRIHWRIRPKRPARRRLIRSRKPLEVTGLGGFKSLLRSTKRFLRRAPLPPRAPILAANLERYRQWRRFFARLRRTPKRARRARPRRAATPPARP
jgi:hypothetical protein